MKTFKKVFLMIVFILFALLAVPFMVVELRNFFSFEFLNMNKPFLCGLAYLSRALYFFLFHALMVFTLLFVIADKKFCIILFANGVAALIGALLSLFFYDYYISLIIIAMTLIPLIIITFGFFKKEKDACLIAKK